LPNGDWRCLVQAEHSRWNNDAVEQGVEADEAR
jgi:hypothetical protein